MTDPTQHSLPDVPDEAVEAIVRRSIPAVAEENDPVSAESAEKVRKRVRADLTAALPSLHAAFEKDLMEKLRDRTISAELLEFTRAEFEGQPNVLSKEEAQLIREMTMSPLVPDAKQDAAIHLKSRLSDWAEERTGDGEEA